jgi:quercetin dioxygenase-like cupin family protein
MTVVSPERAKHGYLPGKDEGEAYWLLGMLEIVKISGADTDGEYGLIEITVRAGEGSPWHVHPDEDEWFYVLEGEFTFYVGDTRLSLQAGSFAFGPKGGAAHLHRGVARGEGPGRLPALPVRGLPARSWRTGGRAGPAAAARGSAGHGATAPDRRAQRDADPRTSRPASRPLSGQPHHSAPARADGQARNYSPEEP